MAKAKAKKTAAVIANPNVIRFELLNDTPGAVRYQEVDDNAMPLVSDEDGVRIGGLYFRKHALGKLSGEYASDGKFPKAVKITVEFE